MIVVADASPLNYLIQIECDTLLPKLFGKVLVPAAVIEELRHAAAPAAVGSWLSQAPPWIEVREVTARADTTLELLDPGEREAIQLAQEIHADLLLIDERRGRLEAKRRAIRCSIHAQIRHGRFLLPRGRFHAGGKSSARAFLSTGVPSGATHPSECVTTEILRRVDFPVVDRATLAGPLPAG